MKNRSLLMGCILIISIITIMCVSFLVGSGNKNHRNEKQRKIGILYMTMNNPYFNVINKEIIAVAQDNGDVVITRDSGLDPERQVHQIQSFIDEKVDIILLNVVDWKAILPILKKVKKAKIPVIAVDTQVYDKEYVVGTITSDNYGAGIMIAKDLMSKCEGGRILLLEHMSNKSSQDRINGFINTLNVYRWPYEIVSEIETYGQLEIAEPKVKELLEKGENIDVVVALNDPAALGAMAALENKGKLSNVLVYGVDGAPEAKAMIYNGMMTGTVAQSPKETGKIAAKCVYDLLSGKEIKEKTILPVKLVTKDNIDEYSLNSWE